MPGLGFFKRRVFVKNSRKIRFLSHFWDENGISQRMDREKIDVKSLCAEILQRKTKSPFVLGISGAPGAGKSTLSHKIKTVLEQEYQLKVLILSLDDFYKTKSERETMAKTNHPLFLQRGVPGTHDLNLLNQTFSLALSSKKTEFLLPVFSKKIDDRLPKEKWRNEEGPFDVVVFEGWCVGVKPETEDELKVFVSDWERKHDSDVTWRTRVNEFLKTYQPLFEKIDWQVRLGFNTWDEVVKNRSQQERVHNQALQPEEVREFLERFYRIVQRSCQR